jgi:hypothetical protein
MFLLSNETVRRSPCIIVCFNQVSHDAVTVRTVLSPIVGWVMSEKLESILKKAVLNSSK